MYSSGSTGRPKEIVHLQHDIPYTVASYAKQVLHIQENDHTFSIPKLFFAYGSSGTYVPGYELRLVDLDGQPVAQREQGDLLVRRDSAAPYYWNRPDKTNHTMRGDRIFTGDRFYEDEDRYFFFCGRSDEMFKVSGQWVSPIEVEATLIKHPAVFENAVIGVQDEAGLVRTKAFVVLSDGFQRSAELVEALQAFVKSQIAPYKYPRIIEFMDSLPKMGTNKIDRQALKRLSGGR